MRTAAQPWHAYGWHAPRNVATAGGGAGGKAVRADQWRAMEDFQKSGKAKAIGVSHYW